MLFLTLRQTTNTAQTEISQLQENSQNWFGQTFSSQEIKTEISQEFKLKMSVKFI